MTAVLTFALTWVGCLTVAIAGAVSLADRQRPTGEFDIGALYAALDAQRIPHVMRITGWLGRPAADFTRASDQ